MKKAIINWRYAVLIALFVSGMMLVMLAFGEDVRPFGIWLCEHVALFTGGIALLYMFARLAVRWQNNGDIPEIFKFPEQ